MTYLTRPDLGTVVAVVIFGLGTALAIGAHLSLGAVEHRARKAYRELVREEVGPPDDQWTGIRTLTGHWGCLVGVLESVRAAGVVLAGAAVLYLAVGS